MSYSLELIIRRNTEEDDRRLAEVWPVAAEWLRPEPDPPVQRSGRLRLSLEDQKKLLEHKLDPLKYGEYLGQRLFADRELDKIFSTALSSSKPQLRVLLTVESEALRELRWERLAAEIDGAWRVMARQQRTPFSIFIPSIIDRSFQPLRYGDLRALILVANPAQQNTLKLKRFDLAAQVAAVRAGLGDLPSDLLAVADGALGPPTLDALCERLTACYYPLLHIICHGAPHPDGDTVLYLTDAAEQVTPVRAADLLDRVGGLGGQQGLPHMAFLNICHSAAEVGAPGGAAEDGASAADQAAAAARQAAVATALGSLARRMLTQLGLRAVVAMADKLSFETAMPLARAFYERLRASGEVDYALVEACAGIGGRDDVTVPVLYSRLGWQRLFSPAADDELSDEQIALALDRAGALVRLRAPVLARKFRRRAGMVRASLGQGPAARNQAAMRAAERICLEALELSLADLARQPAPAAERPLNPFPGLYAFNEDRRAFFCGRADKVEAMIGRLARHPFLAVIGASGCGKSSLVRAGLIPALREREGLRDDQVKIITPGGDPLGQLNPLLSGLLGSGGLLLVDQFEELFTHLRGPAAEQTRRDFVARMLSLLGGERPARVVITMRADFYGDCFALRALDALLDSCQMRLAPLQGEQLRAAVEDQARAAGMRFDEGLSNRIFEQVRGEPGAMALLQHALRELWRRRRGRWLRAAEFDKIGGVRGALSRTANMVFKRLTAQQQILARNIFLRLTRADGEALPGAERRDTRRRVPQASLRFHGVDPAEVSALILRLAEAGSRLLVTGVNPQTDEPEVEVAHEALIRSWTRLQGWLRDDREGQRVREELERRARAWKASAESDDYLMRGRELADIEEAIERYALLFNDEEHAYLAAARSLPAREEERRRAAAANLASLERMAVPESMAGVEPDDFEPTARPRPATPPLADLEIAIRRGISGGYLADMRFQMPDSAAAVELAFAVPLAIDYEGLLALAIDQEAYGRALGEQLFADPRMREAWVRAGAVAVGAGARLRLRLNLDPNAPELHALLWEALRDPETGEGLAARAAFQRYLPSRDLAPIALPAAGNRRILVAVASPADLYQYGLAPIDADARIAGARAALDSWDLQILGGSVGRRCTLPNLLAALRDEPAALYLIAHATLLDGDAYLWLEDEDGRTRRVSAADLAAQIAGLARRPGLTVVGSPTAGSEVGAALGPRLVAAGLPGVLTAGGLPEAEHSLFLSAFFAELGRGEPVDLALAVARARLLPEVLSLPPVFYSRVPDAALWSAAPAQAAAEPVELSVGLARRDGASLALQIELRRSPGEPARPLVQGAPPVALLDLAELAAHAVDPEASYGARLSRMLFADPRAARAVDQARMLADERAAPLLLRLLFDDAEPDLQGLLWETLADPASGTPLFTSERLLGVRGLARAPGRALNPRPREELRALIARPSPANAADYGLATLSRPIAFQPEVEALARAGCTVLDGVVTLDQLRAALADEAPDILVLNGIAWVVEGEWVFSFTDAAGQLAPVPARQLVQAIADLARPPALIALVTSESAGGGHLESAPPAQALARLGLPYVFGFNEKVTIRDADGFCRSFFRELGRDGRAERAAAVARGDMRAADQRWWQPVLLARPDAGPLWA